MKLVALIKCVPVGNHLFVMFPIKNGLKQGDVLPPLLFNFTLQYDIRRVQVNQDRLKLNGTHQLQVYDDDAIILGGSVHTIKKTTDALLVASRETGLDVSLEIRMQDEVTK